MLNSQIRFFEEISLNSWPASQHLFLDGWLLRYNDGYTQRANSVNPIYPGDPAATLEKIHLCEDFYTSKNLPTVFKMTAVAFPLNLDEILESRGYIRKGPTAVQTLELVGLEKLYQNDLFAEKEGAAVRLVLEDVLSLDWLTNWLELHDTSPDKQAAVKKILDNILPAHCFARLEKDGQILAMGLAVCERKHIGLFNIVSNRAFRRQGWGKHLVLELLKWGNEQGAATAYLQVSLENTVALSLYSSLGFHESYQYWYRVKSL